jgi:hypothetical protein
VLTGPPGWLPPVERGGLLAFRWRGGLLQVTPVEVDAGATAERVALLRETFAYHRDAKTVTHWRFPLAAAVIGALLEVPDLLSTALPPLGDVLADLIRPAAEAPRGCPHCRCGVAYEPPYFDEEVVRPPELCADDPVVRPLFP